MTDFGLSDPYVGIMKSVMLARRPGLALVDLSHDVPPQHTALAGFWIERASLWTPAGAVHLVVVDPGVGSERRGVVLEARQRCFVGPDNGLWQRLVDREPAFRARAIDLAALAALPGVAGVEPRSATFHGRDVFAPLAAELAAGGLAFEDVGPPCMPLRGPGVGARADAAGVHGQVLHVDRFGNLITDIAAEQLGGTGWRIRAGSVVLPLCRTYSDVEVGAPVALVNAYESIEIAVRDGSAATALGVSAGAAVSAERQS
jgi:hypothetical protein